jgi:hypothetical protein
MACKNRSGDTASPRNFVPKVFRSKHRIHEREPTDPPMEPMAGPPQLGFLSSTLPKVLSIFAAEVIKQAELSRNARL